MFVFTLLWNIGVVLKRDSTVTKCQFNAKKYSTTAFVLLDANLPPSQFPFEWNPRRLILFLFPHQHNREMRLKCMLVKYVYEIFQFLRTLISQTPRNWLKQDVEGVKSSSFDFFRTISRKTTQQHKRRSIWIMPPCPSAEKHKMFIHAIQTSQIIDMQGSLWPCREQKELWRFIVHKPRQNLNNVAANLVEKCDGKTTQWRNVLENCDQWSMLFW